MKCCKYESRRTGQEARFSISDPWHDCGRQKSIPEEVSYVRGQEERRKDNSSMHCRYKQ